jgi:uncharacterized protein
MKREVIIAKLQPYKGELRKLGVSSLSLFGSVARGEATGGSDVDLAARVGRRVDLFRFATINVRLSEMLDHKVDLICEPVRKRALQEEIDRDRVRVF